MRAAQYAGAAGIVLMVLVSALAVIQRYLLHTSDASIAEIEQYVFLFTAFIVSGSTYAEGEHVKAGMVVRMFPRRGRLVLALAVDLLGLAFCAFMFRAGVLRVVALYESHIKSATSLGTPQYAIALVLPLSMLLLGVAFAQHFRLVYAGRAAPD